MKYASKGKKKNGLPVIRMWSKKDHKPSKATANGSVSKREAAAMLGVHRNTITNWLNAGELHTDYKGRIALTEIERTAQRLTKMAQEYMADIHRRWRGVRIYKRGRKNWPV